MFNLIKKIILIISIPSAFGYQECAVRKVITDNDYFSF